jgi:hypothetical protein
VEVASRRKKEIDPNRPQQFDLAAEKVEKGNPDLVIRDLTASRCDTRQFANEFIVPTKTSSAIR